MFFLFAVIACSSDSPIGNDVYQPFVFSKLQLSKKDNKGNSMWKITSPEARYELGNRLIRAINVEATIFNQSIPTYNIYAQSANILNDGELILLEGGLKINKINGNDHTLTSARGVWNTADEHMELDIKPTLLNSEVLIKSEEVIINHRDKTVLLKGASLVTNNPTTNSKENTGRFKLLLNNPSWNYDTGYFKALGPISGVRVLESLDQYQRISGQSIFGNTNKSLLGIRSCKVYQKNEYIESKRCLWNWNDETLTFSGGAKLRRNSSKLLIDRTKIEAELTEQGVLEFD